MNYKKIYDNLIERAKNRILEEYTEKHHIIPRCIGGSDCVSNIVELTPEEHYLAHQLLVKIYPNNRRLLNAAIMMIPNRPSNKLYGWLKRKYSKQRKKETTGSLNPQYNTIWINKIGTTENIRIKKGDDIPEGWVQGRKLKNKVKKCIFCGNSFEFFTKEKFCSEKCKLYGKSRVLKIIDDNVQEMIRFYKQSLSIVKTLEHFGIPQKTRKGHKYFSDILKKNNIKVVSRNNR